MGVWKAEEAELLMEAPSFLHSAVPVLLSEELP